MSRVHSDDVHAVDEEVLNEVDVASLVGYGGYNLGEFFHKSDLLVRAETVAARK